MERIELVQWLEKKARECEERRDHREAIDFWSKLLSVLTRRQTAEGADVTELASIHYHLGMNHQALKENSKSIYHLKYSIRLDASEPRYYHAFGRAFLRGGQLGVARMQFEQAARLDPQNPLYLRQYAWLLLVLGKASEARLYARKAVQLAPEDEKAKWCLIRAYMDCKMYAHAMNLLKTFKSQANARVAYALEECQFRLNNSAEGAFIRILRQGMRMDGKPFHLGHFRWAEQAWLSFCAFERPPRSRARLGAYAAALSWLSLQEVGGEPDSFDLILERFKSSSSDVWPVIKKFQDFWTAASYKQRV